MQVADVFAHDLAATIAIRSPDGKITLFRYRLVRGAHGFMQVLRRGQGANEMYKFEMSPNLEYLGQSTVYERTRSGTFYHYTGNPPPSLRPDIHYQYSSDATVVMIGVFNARQWAPIQRWNDAVPGLYYIEQGYSSIQVCQPGDWFYRSMAFIEMLTQEEIDRLYGIDFNTGALALPFDEI